jgi:hypothetical protein
MRKRKRKRKMRAMVVVMRSADYRRTLMPCGSMSACQYFRVNVIRVESSNGSLPLTTPKGCLNSTTRRRVCDGAGSPPSHIRRVRNPAVCPRSYAYYLRSRSPHSPHTHTHPLYAVKAGYPPRALTAVIPELPLSSLGLAPGDQLIVVQKSSSAAAPTVPSPSPANPAYPGHTPAAATRATPSSNSNPRQVAPTALSTIRDDDGRPDYVAMDGGYLIHRVRAHPSFNCVALRARACHPDLTVDYLCRSCQMIILVCLHLSHSFLSKICERRP